MKQNTRFKNLGNICYWLLVHEWSISTAYCKTCNSQTKHTRCVVD